MLIFFCGDQHFGGALERLLRKSCNFWTRLTSNTFLMENPQTDYGVLRYNRNSYKNVNRIYTFSVKKYTTYMCQISQWSPCSECCMIIEIYITYFYIVDQYGNNNRKCYQLIEIWKEKSNWCNYLILLQKI